MDLRIFYLEKEERGPDVEKLFLLFYLVHAISNCTQASLYTSISTELQPALFLQQQATLLHTENNRVASPPATGPVLISGTGPVLTVLRAAISLPRSITSSP